MENDMALLEQTQVGRDINRPYLDRQTLTKQLQQPVVRGLMALIQLRNTQPAFDGDFQLSGGGQTLNLAWQHQNDRVEFALNLTEQRAQISSQLNGQIDLIDLSALAEG